VAAVLCIGCIGIFSLHKYIAGAASDGMTIHASIGVRKSLTLADGSKVLLNAGSTLTLADGFGITGRKVTLSGEAYFEVAKNARIPFLVHTSSMDIRVMGTSFNVRSYPDEPRDITSLISGRISVTIRNEGEKTLAKNYYLEPLQKITVNKNGTAIALPGGNSAGLPGKDALGIDSLRVSRLVDQIPETAWTENKLFFDAEPLNEVMERIERWYGVKVRLDNNAIANLHFTGSYRNESLKEVMEALELSNPEIHYRMENNDKLLILY
jgi:ferric-dicitrate binding protein FerR (iron transport regulator)